MIPIQKVNIFGQTGKSSQWQDSYGTKIFDLSDPKASTNTKIKRKQRKLSPTHIEQHPGLHQ
jgi:hypothetical protein